MAVASVLEHLEAVVNMTDADTVPLSDDKPSYAHCSTNGPLLRAFLRRLEKYEIGQRGARTNPAHTVFPSGLGPRSGHKEPGRGRDPLGVSRPDYQSRTRTLPGTPVGTVRGFAAGVGAGVSSGMIGSGATGTVGTEREAAGCAGDTVACSSRASLT